MTQTRLPSLQKAAQLFSQYHHIMGGPPLLCGTGSSLSLRPIPMGNTVRGRNKAASGADQPPQQLANIPPPPHMVDHSFTLQAIMELQKSNGQLVEAITSLRGEISRQEAKIDKLDESLSTIKQKVYAAGIVLMIFVAIGGFIINKAWDLLAQQIVAQQTAKVATPPKP